MRDERSLTTRAERCCYYHNAEIRFTGVEYLELPKRFSHAHFRVASAEEAQSLRRHVEFEGSVFCIIEERDSAEARARFVVAGSVGVNLSTVLYHATNAENAG